MAYTLMHGIRASYKRGCKCLPCRTANADYVRTWRTRKVTGRPIWGQHIPAGDTWRRLRALVTDYGSRAAVSRAYGTANGHIRFGPRVTLRTYVRVLRLYRQMNPEGDSPEGGGAPEGA